MTFVFPDATPVLGNIKIAILDAAADLTAIDLSSEIGAAGTLDVSGFFRGFTAPITTNTGNRPQRLGTRDLYPSEGRTTFGPIEIRYPYDPQGSGSVDANKAKTKLTRGSIFIAVVRKGLPFENDFAATEKYEAWRVRATRQNKVISDGDDLAEFEIQQFLLPISAPVDGAFVA
ncbi:hypothetical protein GCM10022215_24150 [Nocardioides fonticola]|uniref:Phage tail protein n=1 Tax=Nocardioides fonticola TaxID=450363 RepID=A0ABP7XJR9_9ACTN